MAKKPKASSKTSHEKLAHALVQQTLGGNVSGSYYQAIGEIATLWSLFEARVDLDTLHLGDIPLRRGFCLTSQISGIGRKLDAFISMAKLEPIPKHILIKFNTFSKKVRGLAEMRNRIIHDPWFTTDTGELERLEITARNGLRLEIIPTKLNELYDFILSIGALRDEFESIVKMIESARPKVAGLNPQKS